MYIVGQGVGGVEKKHSSDSLVGKGLSSTCWSWEMNCVLQDTFYLMGVLRQIKSKLMSGRQVRGSNNLLG